MSKNNYPNFDFTIEKISDCGARLGKIQTPHGVIETPNFIFCGTKANVKGILSEQLVQCGVQIILSNTYHLMLHPGSDLIKQMGGLHKFMNWNGPLLTDSGGYQIFSLGHGSVSQEIKRTSQNVRNNWVKITEEGAFFKSYIDGSKVFLSPEKSIQIQRDLGVDVMLVLDECTPFNVDKNYTEKSMEMSHRWGLRSLQEFQGKNDHSQAIYGIVQGGIYPDLRKRSVDFVNDHDFFGVAIGGSLGQNKTQMREVVERTAKQIDKTRPVHLLGIGGISDILNCISMGIDTFDCVHPTRIARHGCALVDPLVREGKLHEHLQLRKTIFKMDEDPIDKDCVCHTCKNYSRAYLHFLLRAGEISALNLLTIHNVFYMGNLMERIRDAIKNDNLSALRDKILINLN